MNVSETKSSKASIILGIVNVVLVLLCSKLGIFLLSSTLIILLLVGIVLAFNDFKEKHILIGITGLVINAVAAFMYLSSFGTILLQKLAG